MNKLWYFRTSSVPSYQQISPETPSESSKTSQSYSDRKSFADSEDARSAVLENRVRQSLPITITLWILLFICFCETSALILQHFSRPSTSNASIKTPIPPVRNEIRPWTETPSLENLRTVAEVEEAWSELNLPISGFVYLPNPEDYGLLPNTHVLKGAENVYSVSAYHQLHCLKIMHLTFVELWNAGPSDENYGLEHVEHCIAYIKQGVMCAGDTTLEGPDVGGGTLMGWGINHQCRKWDGDDGLVEKIWVLNDQMFKRQGYNTSYSMASKAHE